MRVIALRSITYGKIQESDKVQGFSLIYFESNYQSRNILHDLNLMLKIISL